MGFHQIVSKKVGFYIFQYEFAEARKDILEKIVCELRQ